MRQQGEGTAAAPEVAASIEPSAVWRVTLAWSVTSESGRQDRVDGLQQLLSARAVVGLMGPGRPTREGMVVDLVLPVSDASILITARDGALQTGPVGDDFAWELHRYTGAVVVNGDLATGDFAVLASDDSLSDNELARLLDEPLQAALLVGTVGTGVVEEVADRLEVSGWISDGKNPVVAARHLPADPTSLILPGDDGLSIALRERPGRVDVLIWGNQAEGETAPPTRRRRAAHRAPLVSTHLGARCRPVVLPEFMRPEGSAADRLLQRLSEDFAPLSGDAVLALGRVLPAARVDALVHAVNDAPTRGMDPEAGVLAPMEEGLMPGEEVAAEPARPAHADARAVLAALGEDPGWARLYDGVAPVGRGARPLGKRVAEAETASMPPVEGRVPDAPKPPESKTAHHQSAGGVPVAPPVEGDLPTLAQAGDRSAAARLQRGTAPEGGRHGGFSSLVQRHTAPVPVMDFDAVVRPHGAGGANDGGATVTPRAVDAQAAHAQSGHTQAAHTQAAPESAGMGSVPRPTPAAGTPASSAGDDSALAPRRNWPVVLLIVGLAAVVCAGILAWVAPNLGAATGTGYIVAIALGIAGLGAAIVGGTSLRR